ncbi:MAG: hypothetical protein JWQ44_2144 [Chthoniobacter sp.]|nr:hypothetical protein [Chthoniobacter sp.]
MSSTSEPRCETIAVHFRVKPLPKFGAALALFAAGLIGGFVVRSTGTSERQRDSSVAISEKQNSEAPLKRTAITGAHPAIASGNFAERLRALAKTGNRLKRARAIAGIADELDSRQVRDALADLDRRSVRDADEIRLQLLARWAQLEPDAALQYAQALPSGFEAPSAIEAVIRSWAAHNLKAAEAGVARMAEGSAKKTAHAALAPALSEVDPRRAFAAVRELPFSSSDIDLFFQNWAENDPLAASAHAAQLPDSRLRSFALRYVAQKWAEVDREAALAWAQTPPPNPPGVTIQVRDPGPLAAVIRSWLKTDASDAMAWVEQLPEGAEKTDVLAALTRSLSDEEPRHAVEFAAMMPEGKAQDSALRNLIAGWSQKDFAGALEWAQHQPDEEVRQLLLPTLAGDLAWRDTAAAVELALEIGGDGSTRAISSILQIWTRREPAAAAQWVRMQPDRAKHSASVAEMWAEKDANSALRWVNETTIGDERDEALSRGANMVAQTEQPRRAEKWIEGIASAERRAKAYQTVAFWWLRNQPKSAREWIKTAPLSAQAKSALLKEGGR